MAEEQEYIVYTFKWKEIKGEWQTLEVIGHKFFEENNRMVLYKGIGGIFEWYFNVRFKWCERNRWSRWT